MTEQSIQQESGRETAEQSSTEQSSTEPTGQTRFTNRGPVPPPATGFAAPPPSASDQAFGGGEPPAQVERGNANTEGVQPAPQLRASRFAGDTTLEACFEDRARLAPGARGPSVQKVQQALLDLGYSIGDAGADGVYGAPLWEAVKQFKTREHLGWEHMGDVGPGTMHRLDQIFGAPTPTNSDAERATDGGVASAQDFVITSDEVGDGSAVAGLPPALDDETLKQMLLAQPEDDLEVAGAQAPLPGGHVSWDVAMQRFKSKVDVANPGQPGLNVTDKGQFFWGRQLGVAVKTEIDALRSAPDSAVFCTAATRAWDAIFAGEDGVAELAAAAAAAQRSKSPAKARMLTLVHGFTGGGAGVEAMMWADLNQRGDNKVDLARFRSLVTLRTVRKFDKVGCTVHMLRAAERVKKKGGLVGRDPKVGPLFKTLASGTGVRDRKPRDPDRRHLGDVVDQSGVGGAVAALMQALDAGLMVHARVLSGVGVGSTSVPAEPNAQPTPIGIPGEGEHSVLIIGYDNNKFVFNDPDASESKNPGGGFGFMYFDGTHFGTARNANDLRVDANGDHYLGDHRYQVLYLASV